VIDTVRRAAELQERGEPYVMATVVRVDRPVSARVGDRAIVYSDGRLEGWIGGSCSEPIVIREALSSLGDRDARLVRIRPPGAPAEAGHPGVVTEVTACASEGGLDIFVEPRLPGPHLAIAGSSPAARTLARLAGEMGYRVTAVLDAPSEKLPGAGATMTPEELARMSLGPNDAVAVATMNRYDEAVLEAAIASGASYIGLIASRPRGEKVMEMLRARGVSEADLKRIRNPAGIDLGPSNQDEIALGVLAEVVRERHAAERVSQELMCEDEEETLPAQAVDPVCGMTVAIHEGAITAVVGAQKLYFCARGCRDEYLRTVRDELRNSINEREQFG
jgi:xanthine dehydrogenase accessory factor